MNAIISCEESQIICIELRKLGHNAYSNDLKPCSGGHPEWHLQMDAKEALYIKDWDLVIAHPPCTRLANSGRRWLFERNLWDEFHEAVAFFNFFVNFAKENKKVKMCIENPIQHEQARKYIIPYQQLIQPWQFGHMESKATCLWLFNLPRLVHTNNVWGQMMQLPIKERQRIWWMGSQPEQRSKTFPGIAKAMAEQWTSAYTLQKGFFD